MRSSTQQSSNFSRSRVDFYRRVPKDLTEVNDKCEICLDLVILGTVMKIIKIIIIIIFDTKLHFQTYYYSIITMTNHQASLFLLPDI